MKKMVFAFWVCCAFAVSAEPAVRWLVVHTNGTVCPEGFVATPADLNLATSALGVAISELDMLMATNRSTELWGTNQWIDGQGVVRQIADEYTVLFTGNLPDHPADGTAFPFSASTWSGGFSGGSAYCNFSGDPGTPLDDRAFSALVTGEYPLYLLCEYEGYGTCIVHRATVTNVLGTLARIDQITASQAGAVATNDAAFLAAVTHTNRTDNPHAVTATQAGAVSIAQNAALKEITGFADPSDVTVSYNSAARTITVSQTGGVSLWWRGTNIVWGSPWTSPAHTNVSDKYYLAMRTGTNVEWSTSAWTFDMLQIAYVNGGSATIGFREPHGLMQWQAHESAHRNIGCYRLSGLAPVAGTYAVQSAVNSNNTPTFAAGVIQDEDNPTSIAQVNEGAYTILNFTNRVAYFETNVANLVYIGSTYPLINTAASNNVETVGARYFNVWQMLMPVTADAQSQAYRMVFVQPQLAHSSLAAAQAEDFRALNLGDFTTFGPEFVAFCKFTFGTSASYSSAGKMRIESVSYLSGSQASQTVITSLTSPSTADAISVAATPSNYGAAAANVESHFLGIDSKFGAAITNQTWGAAGTNATYRMLWDITNGTFRVEEILP